MYSQNPAKRKRSTTYSVEFPTLPSISKPPTFVDLIQKQNSHDILVLRFTTTSTMWVENLKTGVPVKFSWKQDDLSRVWYGYVSFVSRVVASQKLKTMEVYCIGSSFVLKEGVVRTFSNTTITDAVSQIAKEFGLNFIGESHPRVFDQLTIAGHSYWEWINEQAKRIGYGVYTDGANLVFRPFDKLIDQTIYEAPILEWTTTIANVESQLAGNTLEYFKVLNGEMIEFDQAARSIKITGGVDPYSSKETYSSTNPSMLGQQLRETVSDTLFSEYRSDYVVHTDVDSKAASDGSATLARFNMPAYVKAKGDPRFRPYGIVSIKNTGTLTDGYWVIKEVTHRFSRNRLYEAEMTVITDGTGPNEKSHFRASNAEVVGIVNTGRVLANEAMILRLNTTKLQQDGTRVNQSGQGYLRTPARWVTTI